MDRVGVGGGDQRAKHHAEPSDDPTTEHSCLSVMFSEHIQPYKTIWFCTGTKFAKPAFAWASRLSVGNTAVRRSA